MAVCSEIHTKHINTLCGYNVDLLNIKLAVHIVTTELQTGNSHQIKSLFPIKHPPISLYTHISFSSHCVPTSDRAYKSIFMTMSVCQSVCPLQKQIFQNELITTAGVAAQSRGRGGRAVTTDSSHDAAPQTTTATGNTRCEHI